jgi:hypothetical protein
MKGYLFMQEMMIEDGPIRILPFDQACLLQKKINSRVQVKGSAFFIKVKLDEV